MTYMAKNLHFAIKIKRSTDGQTDRPTDRPTDRRTDRPSYRDARTHLKSEEIRKMISKPLAQFSSKKFNYWLNLVYKHILFEKGGHTGVLKVFGA